MTRTEQIAGWRDAAKQLGKEAGTNAASWIVDGNSDVEAARATLNGLRDGDPAASDAIDHLRPNLSGEWADAMDQRRLFEAVTSLDSHAEATWNFDAYGEVCDALADAWEEGVSETFEQACEAELSRFVGN